MDQEIHNNYRFISINTDNSIDTLQKLREFIQHEKPIGIAIQDLPSLKTGDLIRICAEIAPNYVAFFNGLQQTSSLAKYKNDNLILLHQSVKPTIITKQPSASTSGSRVAQAVLGVSFCPHGSKRYCFYSVYLRPKYSHDEVDKILTYIGESSSGACRFHRIIMGDFNASSPDWNPIDMKQKPRNEAYSNKLLKQSRGRSIVKFMKDYHLLNLNQVKSGPSYEYKAQDRISFLDLALVSRDMIKYCKGFRLAPVGGKTLHSAIIIERRHLKVENVELLALGKLGREMFSEFNDSISKYLHGWHRNRDNVIFTGMNWLTEQLYVKLLDVQKKITVKRSISECRVDVWSPKLDRLIKKLKKNKKIMKECKKAQVQSRAIKKKFEQAYGLVKSLENSLKLLVNMDAESNHDYKPDEQSTCDELNQDQLDTFVRDKFMLGEKEPPKFDRDLERISINNEEIELAIKSMLNLGQRDHYGLSYKLLAHAYQYCSTVINELAKMSFYIGKLPTSYSITRGKLIPKSRPNAYRCIHISSAIIALLENIAHNRLRYSIEKLGLFHINQYAFDGYRDRFDLFTRIYDLVVGSKDANAHLTAKNRLATIIQLDIEAAFDSLDHEALATVLYHKLPEEPIKYWIVNFLLNRCIHLTGHGGSERYAPVQRGLPQGSSLAPLLWNLALFDALSSELVIPREMEILAYADDLFVISITKHSSPPKVNHQIGSFLEKLASDIKSLGLHFNAEKSKFISSRLGAGYTNALFAGRLDLHLGETSIERVELMNILGLTVHAKGFQPTCEEIGLELSNNLTKNVRKLYSLRKLNIYNKPSEWQTQIDWLLTNSTMNNYLPLLAMHEPLRRKFEEVFGLAVKNVFSLSDGLSNKLLRLFCKSPSPTLLVKRWLEKKLITVRDQHLLESYKFMHEKFTGTVREVSGLKVPNLRKCANPEYLFRSSPLDWSEGLNLDSYQHDGRVLVVDRWILVELSSGSLAVQVSGTRFRPFLLARHKMEVDRYYHTIAMLLHLTQSYSEDIHSNQRNLVMSKDSSLYRALANNESQKAYIVELRESLIAYGWKVYHMDGEYHTDVKRCALRAIGDDLHNLQVKELSEPNLAEVCELKKLEDSYATARGEDFEDCMTEVCKRICSNYAAWQKVPMSMLSNMLLFNLAGMIQDSQGNICSAKAEPGVMPKGCTDPVCVEKNQDGNILLHRLFDCPRFNAMREELMPARESIEYALSNYDQRKGLFKFIRICSVEGNNDCDEDSDVLLTSDSDE